MHFQSRVSTTAVQELFFADDCALNATTKGDVQRSIDLFPATCKIFGLIIRTEMKVATHQPPPHTAPYNAPQISVNGTQLQVVDNFTYLGSTLARSAKTDEEVARRISKASQAFGCLKNTVWKRHGLHVNTKLKMCKADILPTLLYGAETWTVYKKRARRLNQIHLGCPRWILKVRWQDRIPDTIVLERARILSMYTMLRQLQLR
ncbi:hypothetical protein SprV_0200895900 [Sparganum proliferum]